MTQVVEAATDVVYEDVAQRWLDRFASVLETRNPEGIDELFVPHGSWRDLLALTWDIRSAIGTDAIRQFLTEHVCATPRDGFACQSATWVEVSDAVKYIQVIFTFETKAASSRGLVNLVPDQEEGWRAWALVTDMVHFGETYRPIDWSDAGRPEWNAAQIGRRSWADRHDPARPFDTEEPSVVVVGAGQSGLQTAARLQRDGVDVFVLEKQERPGDSWRNRYYSLITHTPSFADQFAFMPFPDSWPMCVSKDQLAEWCAHYASAMDLNVWTSTEVMGGNFDATSGRWSLRVRRSSGEVQVLRPRHLVLATGLLSIPYEPDLPGRDDFRGVILHSHHYKGSAPYRGKRVVVVGSGASGHDIAQELVEHGVTDVTMVQRSSTYVMSFKHGITAAFSHAYGPDMDVESADLINMSLPMPVAIEVSKATTKAIAEQDRELLEGLQKVGFKLNDRGLLDLGANSGTVSGYYINQGASDLIISGDIKLKRGAVVGFDEAGVLFADGSRLDADVVVLCTGYYNMREGVRRLLGDRVADKLPEVWVPDPARGGEKSGLWTESGYPHLWLIAGALFDGRIGSKYVALNVRAALEGIKPERGDKSVSSTR